MEKSNDKQEFGKKQKWSFGLGSFGQWFINSAFNTWVFSFYYSAVGLNVMYIVLAYLLWTIWNAFNDPFIGFLSDRTSTRFGRRKPYILIGTIPILILEIILWLPPVNSQFITFIYLLIMLMCYDTFYTMVALPYDSLFPELYTSVEERAEVNTIKQILATLGMLLAFIVPGVFIQDIASRNGYLLNGIVTSTLVGISLLISLIWGVKEREEFKLDHQQKFGFFEGLKYALKNKGFVLYTIMFFLYQYILLELATVVPLFGKHVLDADAFYTSLLLGMMFLVGIITVVLWNRLDLRFGSRKAYALAIVVYFIASLPMLFVDTYLNAVIVSIFMGVGFGGMLYFIYLLIADVIDEDELRTGVRREGTFFGVTNFFMRLAMVLSILTVGLVFSSTGWEEYDPLPGVNVILGLRFLVVIFPGIALCLTLICLYYYPFTKERVQEIKKELNTLHTDKLNKVRSRFE